MHHFIALNCIAWHCRVHDSEFKDLPSLLFLLEQSHARLAAVELRSMIFMPCTSPLIAKTIPQPNENDTLIAKNVPQPNENDIRETSLDKHMRTRKKNNLSSRYLTQIEEEKEVEKGVEKEVEKEKEKEEGVEKIGLSNTTFKGHSNGINGMLMGHSGRDLYGNSTKNITDTPWYNNNYHDRNQTSSYSSSEDRAIVVSVSVGVGVGAGEGWGVGGRGTQSGGGIGDGSLFNRIHNSIGK